jgi:beta-glucosidase
VTNTGKRAGATVAQVYLTSQAGKPVKRLAAFERVELTPGESRTVTMPLDPRLLANWNGKDWSIPAGKYTFIAAESAADHAAPSVEVAIAPMKLKP